MFIRTLRNIKPEEELTYDYGRDYLKNVIGLENCLCPRCRKRRKKVAAEARLKRARKAKRLANAAAKGKTGSKTSSKSSSKTRKTAKKAVRKTAKKRGSKR